MSEVKIPQSLLNVIADINIEEINSHIYTNEKLVSWLCSWHEQIKRELYDFANNRAEQIRTDAIKEFAEILCNYVYEKDFMSDDVIREIAEKLKSRCKFMKLLRGFEVVADNHRKTDGSIVLPTRATKNSAGYDFCANDDYVVEPNAIVKIWTDIKAYMQHNEVLLIDIRSSMGGKWMLANTIGIIDADYYGNSSNDGNIGIFLKNISGETQEIHTGDRIAQGIFVNYLIADNDNATSTRNGGFGSTN